MKKLILSLSLLSLSACNYSNTFTGTFNGKPATMSAYSKNINKYCVALNIQAGNETKSSFISAQAVFDENDFLKPMSFNTKGASCSVNLDEYLVGTRNTTVLNVYTVTEREQVGVDYCRYATYKAYQYKEQISFEVKKNANDETVGTFTGTGEVSNFVDRGHPVDLGRIYFCGVRPNPNYPYPGPGYPYPYPHPRNYPYPYPYGM